MHFDPRSNSQKVSPKKPFFTGRNKLFAALTIATVATVAGVLATPANAENAEIAATQSQLDEAQNALVTAQQDRTNTIAQRDTATQKASDLNQQASNATKQADEATRAYLRLIREGTAPTASLVTQALTAKDSSNKDLLTGLTMADKTSELFEEGNNVGDAVATYRKTAKDLTQEAAVAEAAVGTIAVSEAENAVTSAEAEVTSKRDRLELLKKQEAEAAAQAALAEADTTISDTAAVNPVAGGWIRPVPGRVTDEYGPRPERPAGAKLNHGGTDFSASCKTEIVAASGGIVKKAGPSGGLGNYVEIEHGNGETTGYAHMQDGGVKVSVGQRVEAGTLIGLVGTTGQSTGCHLHLTASVGGKETNPRTFLASKGLNL